MLLSVVVEVVMGIVVVIVVVEMFVVMGDGRIQIRVVVILVGPL